jgi:hypothetical protein
MHYLHVRSNKQQPTRRLNVMPQECNSHAAQYIIYGRG